MFPMTPAKCSLFLALALSLLLFCACPALAALKYIKSDGFAHGSIAGQVTNGPLSGKWTGGAAEGFTNDDPGQQEVTSDAAHTGSNSWRFSGGYSSAGEATPFSPRLGHDICAGQPSSGADADVFEVSFWFKAVSPDVNTQLVQVVPGNTAGTDRASNAFHLNNIPGTGVTVRTFQPTGGWNGYWVVLTSGIDNAWHKIEMTGRFYDGPSNDLWTYSFDGVVLGTYGAFYETARDTFGWTYEKMWWLKFKPLHDDNRSDQGFYFDDISYRAYRSTDSNNILASYYTSFEPARYRQTSAMVLVR